MRSGRVFPYRERPLGEGRTLVKAEQGVVGVHLQLFQKLWRRLVLDDDGDVFHGVAETLRNVPQHVLDERSEPFPGHSTHILLCEL